MIQRAFQEWFSTIRGLFRYSSAWKSELWLFLIILLPLGFFVSGYLDTSILERKVTDMKIRFLSRSLAIDPRLVILEIDSESLREVKHQWPWPRAIYAEILQTLQGSSPSGIIFTILFQQLEKGSEAGSGDLALIATMKAMGNVFLPQLLQDSPGGEMSPSSLLSPHELFCAAGKGLGVSKVVLDDDNIARLATVHFPRSTTHTLISLALATLGRTPPEHQDQLCDGRNVMVLYAQKGRIPKIPISYLLAQTWKQNGMTGRLSPYALPEWDALFRDKLVFIGVTAPILHDQYFTPGGYLSGVEILAHAVNTCLQNRYVRQRQSPGLRLFFLVLVALISLMFLNGTPQTQLYRVGVLLGEWLSILGLNFLAFHLFQIQTPVMYLLSFSCYLFCLQTVILGFHERLKTETMERELEIGRKMQTFLLPHSIPRLPGVEIFAESRPAKEIGGDLFDFIRFPDGRMGFLVGDVAGKGVQAGLFMGMAGLMLKHIGSQASSPAEALIRTSQAFRDHFDGSAPTYLTACFAIFDPRTNEFTVANAGHEPPVILRPPDFRPQQLPLFGLPLGPVWLFDRIEYSDRKIPIESGMQVIFFSDGFTEAFNAEGKMFGKDRFFAEMERSAGEFPETLGKRLFDRIATHEKGIAPSDDKTLVIVQFSSTPEITTSLIDQTLDGRFDELWRDSGGGAWQARELNADIHLLNDLANQLLDELSTQDFSSPDCFAVELLLEEAFSNAWKHGCRKDDRRKIRILTHVTPDVFEAFVRDDGTGFRVPRDLSPSAGEEDNQFRDSGRGLGLLRSYASQVAFNQSGNTVFFRKDKTPDSAPQIHA
jgi:CHASE2 domain-containing sensor protein/anti-sigma regulatory factor (Ser/Thr protein kinase)